MTENVEQHLKRLEADILELRLDLMLYLRELNDKIEAVSKSLKKENGKKPTTAELMDAERRTGKLIAKHFSMGELDDLLMDFGLRAELIPGNTLDAKAKAFTAYMARRSKLGPLVKRCVQLRPKAYGWPIEEIEEY